MTFRISKRGAVGLRLLIVLNIAAVTFLGASIFILAAGPKLQEIIQTPACNGLSFLKSLILILLIVIVIVAVSMIFLLERAIKKPISELEGAARKIGGGELDVRVKLRGPVEIARLAQTVNSMCESLKQEQKNVDRQLAELIKVNEELKSAHKELLHKEALSLVGQMTAGLTHEIGNPLSTIIGYIEIMKEDDISPELRSEYLRRVYGELKRIHNTLQGLLEFSRPSQGNIGRVQLEGVLKETLELLEVDSRLKEIEFRTDIPADLPLVKATREGVKQILINLILNAADACDKRGIVTLRAIAENDAVTLVVSDTGVGIAEEHLEKIFEPFFSTKTSGKGTGLGLAVSKRLVESFGGAIYAENNPSGGASFVVTFPKASKISEHTEQEESEHD
ncbi:MAG: hypothetical protein Kow0090_18260 [Myxococcota bacterium]